MSKSRFEVFAPIIIKALKENNSNISKEKTGEAQLTSFLKNENVTLSDKLQIVSQILTEFGKDKAQLAKNNLSKYSPEECIAVLKDMKLATPELLDNLIEFLLEHKIIRNKNKKKIYVAIIEVIEKKNAKSKAESDWLMNHIVYFSEKMLKLGNLNPAEKEVYQGNLKAAHNSSKFYQAMETNTEREALMPLVQAGVFAALQNNHREVITSLEAFYSDEMSKRIPAKDQYLVFATLLKSYLELGKYVQVVHKTNDTPYAHESEILEYRQIALFQLKETQKTKKVASEISSTQSNNVVVASIKAVFKKSESTHAEDKNADTHLIMADINQLRLSYERSRDISDIRKAKEKIKLLENKKHLKVFRLIQLHHIHKIENNYISALECLQEAVKDFDEAYLALYFMRVYQKLGQLGQSAERAKYILSNWDNEFRFGRESRLKAYSALLESYMNTDREAGITLFETYLKDLNQAETTNRHIQNEIATIQSALANLYHSRGIYAEAANYAKEAIKFESINTRLISLILIKSLYHTGQPKECISYLVRAVKTDPNSAYLHSLLGMSYYQLGEEDFDLAVDNLEKALALDPFCLSKLKIDLPDTIGEALTERKAANPILNEYQNNDEESSSEDEEEITLNEEKNADATSSTAGINTILSLNSDNNDFARSLHQAYQLEKIKNESQAETENEEEEKTVDGWHLPNVGFIAKTDSRIHRMPNANSNLFIFLNTQALNCSEKLEERFQKMLENPKTVGKYGQQGIRRLNNQESAQVAKKGFGYGIFTKLKLLGADGVGKIRAYGHQFSSTVSNETLISFDALDDTKRRKP